MKACVALRVPCYSYLVHFFTSGRRITSARFGLEGVGRTSVGHGVGNTKEQNWHRIYSQTLFTQFSSHPYLCLPWMLDIFSINNCTKFFLHLLKDGLRFRNGNIQLWRTSAWSTYESYLKMWKYENKFNLITNLLEGKVWPGIVFDIGRVKSVDLFISSIGILAHYYVLRPL